MREELWLIQFGELKSIVEHHVKEEENEMFPIAKKIISQARAESLTQEVEAEKKKMLLKNKFQ